MGGDAGIKPCIRDARVEDGERVVERVDAQPALVALLLELQRLVVAQPLDGRDAVAEGVGGGEAREGDGLPRAHALVLRAAAHVHAPCRAEREMG